MTNKCIFRKLIVFCVLDTALQSDCYVAVCGLPEPRKDHAVVMARFACQCVTKHVETVQKLELELGPETGDLRIRIGLHSGPVTAGV